MVKYAYNINEVVPKFLEFAKDLPLVGHNIMFDYSFIKKAIVNYGEAYERLGIDTLKLSRKFLPNLEKKNLNYVCEYLNIKNENHHRALNDALAAHIIFEKLKKQFYHSNLEQFQWKPLLFKVKKEQPMTKFQKEYLIDFIKYHKIVININIDLLTKSECSRLIDTLISQYGRVKRNKQENGGILFMLNMNNKKTKKMVTAIIAGLLVVCMVIPALLSAILAVLQWANKKQKKYIEQVQVSTT